jgi:hypothetical protein
MWVIDKSPATSRERTSPAGTIPPERPNWISPGLITGVAMFGALAYVPTFLQMVTGATRPRTAS